MILSRSLGFLFIKGKKVAGTSVEMALAQLCGPDDIVTPISALDECARAPHNARNFSADPAKEKRYIERMLRGETAKPPQKIYYNHMSIDEVEALYGDISGFNVIYITRNPYTKIISWANWIETGSTYNSGGELKSSIARVQRRVDRGLESGKLLGVLNIKRYRLHGVLSGTAWRYETLNEQIAAWAADKGPITLPHAKAGLLSDGLAIQEWLTAPQIRQITDLFQEEFEAFGYQPII